MEELIYYVSPEEAGRRLDAFCADACPDLSREHIKKIIGEGGIAVDGAVYKPSYKVTAGEEIHIRVPDPVPCEAQPEDIPLNIVYEDGDVLVVDKPKGMVVHPAPGNYTGTLVNALLYHTTDLSGIGGVARPGIIHRIDKDTSGLLMVAKNDLAHLSLSAQLKDHSITRQYRALVRGIVKEDRGTVDMPIGRHPKDRVRMAVVAEGGRAAVTHFEVVERFDKGYTLMTFRLETGRTHQIRVHMLAIGHPIAGDTLYKGDRGNPFKTQGQCLHAEKLGFIHPRTGEYMEFTSPLPEYFERIIKGLR
jgi:23S rRNA pseudouridine1911/1915/1917 synthase